MSRKLYLGLRSKAGTFHYPVIKIVPLDFLLPDVTLFTHLIFTSQTAVEYWKGPLDKKIIAIGPETARKLEEKGLFPLVPPVHTQEGIMQILKEDQSYLIPRSKRARSDLSDFMTQKKIPFLTLDLYDVSFQKPLPVPNLDDFDEIIFTSPSTVEGFLQIFKEIPKNKKLTAIGPITEKAIQKIALRL